MVCEIALSLVLLVSAGLLARTLFWLQSQNPGFDPRSLVTAQTSLNDARYSTVAAVDTLYRKGLNEIQKIPGVQSAAVALTLPYESPLNWGFRVIGLGDKESQQAETIYVTASYFETMRIHVIGGRGFRDGDTADNLKVAVVSDSFAKKYLDGERSALGRQIALSGVTFQVAGVVEDVQQHSRMGDFGPISVTPTIYLPIAQLSDEFMSVHVWFSPSWVVRSSLAPGNLAAKLNRAIASVDPRLPVANFQSVDALSKASTIDERYQAALFVSFAGLALLLSVIGLYALVARSVAQRTREIGIRMALGADVLDAMRTVLAPALRYGGLGISCGVVLSIAASRFLTHLVWGIPVLDPATFVAAGVVLGCCMLLASLVPASRVMRIDPAQTLRHE